MARDITVTFSDGSTHVYQGAPDNITPDQVEARAARDFAGKRVTALDGGRGSPAPAPAAPASGSPPAEGSRARAQQASAGILAGTGKNLLYGLARGGKDVIDTGAEALAGLYDRLTGGGEAERVRAMNAAGRAEFERDTAGSTAAQVGRVGGQVLATLPVGGVVAAPLAAAARAGIAPGVLAPLATAVRTSGMRTGLAPTTIGGRAANMGVRMAGGAVAGGAGAAAVDPSSAGGGAAIGAAFPLAARAAGALGQATGATVREVVEAFGDPRSTGARELLRALDADPAGANAIVQALRGAPELVPGVRPTVAQALMTPQASILQRVVHDSPGGEALRRALVAQSEGRTAALGGVADIAPAGYAQMRADTGEAIARYAQRERGAAREATREAYNAIPQDEAALYLPDLGAVRDKFFGPGSFTSRESADAAVKEAQRIGATVVEPLGLSAGQQPRTLAQAIRAAGGLNLSRNDGFAGELRSLSESLKGITRRDGGMAPDRMAITMYEAGYIDEPSAKLLMDTLRDEAGGMPVYARGADFDRTMRAQQEAAGMGNIGELIPTKVTLREFDNLRKSIGQLARAAETDPARATEAAALKEMKATLDERINEVVRGDGAPDEVLPIAWADALDQARKLKLAEVERFLTGPQAALFKKGSTGEPLVQGGEVAAKFWGNRPGVAEDVQALRRLIADNPRLLGQFRSMIVTEGAGTATQQGLGDRFVKWVRSSLPGLQKAFDPADVATLRNIASDIERAGKAAGLGKGPGSNTYQNAANALDAGLLDSSLVRAVTQRAPIARGLLEPIRASAAESAGKMKASRLAELLADANTAADALDLVKRQPNAFRSLLDAGGNAVTDPLPRLGVSIADLARAASYRAAPLMAAQ